MVDVFISYSRKDRAHADAIAKRLPQDLNIWWDRDLLSGSAFVKEINAKLADAKCILVLWSPNSLNSGWVMAEAMEGFDSNRLVQIGLQVTPIVPFKILHYVVLEGEASDQDIANLTRAIRATISGTRGDMAGPEPAADASAPATVAAPAPATHASEAERAQAVADMNASHYANVLMGFSTRDLLLAVLLVGLAAAIVIANLVAPIPAEWVNGSLVGAAVLCGVGVLLMLRTTLSFLKTRTS